MSTRSHLRVIDTLNPAAFNPALGQPGDLVLDMTGATQGCWQIRRTAPNTNELVQLGSPYTPPAIDTAVLVATSTGAGQRTLTWTLRDGTGAIRAFCGVSVMVACDLAIAADILAGRGVLFGSAESQAFTGQTDAAGQVSLSITGTTAENILSVFNSISVAPVSAFNSTVIP